MDITAKLLKWYDENRRDLPWRGTRDPYLVWVSEIILQQTRVDQGLEYYCRFLTRFPDIQSLAGASLDDVMRAWQGLGYYSRARNMAEAARTIVKYFDGRFPSDYEQIRALKGIGPYTAAAIASICFDQPLPVVDGNVIRFLSRLYGIDALLDTFAGRRTISDLAERLLDPKRPGDFNQAMMEFGAIACRPANPDCRRCIFQTECVAYGTNRVRELPRPRRQPIIRHRWFTYLYVRIPGTTGTKVMLGQRQGDDIWKGLYEFPLIEMTRPVSSVKLVRTHEWKEAFKGIGYRVVRQHPLVRHPLTHQMIHAVFFEIEANRPLKGDYLAVAENELGNYPVPKLIQDFIRALS